MAQLLKHLTVTKATTAVPVAPPPTRLPEPEYDVFLRREQRNDADGHRDMLSIDIRRDVADAAFRGAPVNLAITSLELDGTFDDGTAFWWYVVLRSIGTDAAPASKVTDAEGNQLTAPVLKVGTRKSAVCLTSLSTPKDLSTYRILRVKSEAILGRHKLSALPGPAIGIATNVGSANAQLDLTYWFIPEAAELHIYRAK